MAATNLFPVFLVRHGRTALNAENRLRGRLDPDLDDVGRAEANELADMLATAHPVRVVSSPLRRAAQTAQAIADRAGLDVVLAQGLNDRDYGEWAGQPKDQVVARWGSIDAAPGVEPAAAVFYRACAVLDHQLHFLGAGPVVLVSHDAVNRLLLAHFDESMGPVDSIGQRTACWNELERVVGDWQVRLVDQKAPVGSVAAR